MKKLCLLALLTSLACLNPALAEFDDQAPADARVGNCDLMASTTLRAVYVGPVDIDGRHYYRFTVSTTLAYKAYNRYANRPLRYGQTLDIDADSGRPGQPGSVLNVIASMQPGEEAVMLIDHVFLFVDDYYGNQIVCTRIAPIRPGAAATGAKPPSSAGLPSTSGLPETETPGLPSVGGKTPDDRSDRTPSLPAPSGGDDTIIETGNPQPIDPDRPLLPEGDGF